MCFFFVVSLHIKIFHKVSKQICNVKEPKRKAKNKIYIFEVCIWCLMYGKVYNYK